MVHESILKPRKIEINLPFIEYKNKFLKNKKKSITTASNPKIIQK